MLDMKTLLTYSSLFLSASIGYHVIATARKIEAISHLRKAGMTTLSLDVTKPESVTAIKTEVEKLSDGKLDVLVNNA